MRVARHQHGFTLIEVVEVGPAIQRRRPHRCWHISRFDGDKYPRWDGRHHETFSQAWKSLELLAKELCEIDQLKRSARAD